MESLLEFSKGPLFRFSLAIMLLGLLRVFYLSVANGLTAKKNAKDKNLPGKYVRKMTLGFLIPIRAFRVKPVYSIVSIIFHAGILITPLFLFDHLLLIENETGFGWLSLSLSKSIADNLTLVTLASGIILFLMRITSHVARFISRKQDYLWPLLLMVPFITGYICSNVLINPSTYYYFMLFHVLSACLIFILMPFTKIAHCVLLPLNQWITARVWKFPPEAGEKVLISLGKEGEKI